MSLSFCTLLTENSCCWAQDPEPVEFRPQSWSAASPWPSLAKPDRRVPASQSQSTGLFKTTRREGLLYYSAANAKMVVVSFEYIKPALRSPHKRGLPRLVYVSHAGEAHFLRYFDIHTDQSHDCHSGNHLSIRWSHQKLNYKYRCSLKNKVVHLPWCVCPQTENLSAQVL